MASERLVSSVNVLDATTTTNRLSCRLIVKQSENIYRLPASRGALCDNNNNSLGDAVHGCHDSLLDDLPGDETVEFLRDLHAE